MEIIRNKAVLLKLREPKDVTTVIPESRRLGNNKVVVKWGVDETHALKKLNIDVPSPYEAGYHITSSYYLPTINYG